MYDPLTVVFSINRPPLTRRELRGRKVSRRPEPRRLYRHHQFGFLNVRPRRFDCAHCDGGKVKDPPPSYQRDCYPGQECPDCRGRGYSEVSWTRRLYWGFHFFRLGQREWYLPSVLTVWHVDPEKPTPHGRQDDSCRADVRRRQLDAHKDDRRLEDRILWWRFCHMHWWHVHHWKVQVNVWQNFNRWAWSRCKTCGGRFRWGESPVSDSWGGNGPRWRQPEQSVHHMRCREGQGAAQEASDAVA